MESQKPHNEKYPSQIIKIPEDILQKREFVEEQQIKQAPSQDSEFWTSISVEKQTRISEELVKKEATKKRIEELTKKSVSNLTQKTIQNIEIGDIVVSGNVPSIPDDIFNLVNNTPPKANSIVESLQLESKTQESMENFVQVFPMEKLKELKKELEDKVANFEIGKNTLPFYWYAKKINVEPPEIIILELNDRIEYINIENSFDKKGNFLGPTYGNIITIDNQFIVLSLDSSAGSFRFLISEESKIINVIKSQKSIQKSCPVCSETIQENAIKCIHCGEWLQQLEQPQITKVTFVKIFIYVMITMLSLMILVGIWSSIR